MFPGTELRKTDKECTLLRFSSNKVWFSLQDRILPSLSSVFASLLADRNWLLEQHSLEAFTQFAEVINLEGQIGRAHV